MKRTPIAGSNPRIGLGSADHAAPSDQEKINALTNGLSSIKMTSKW